MPYGFLAFSVHEAQIRSIQTLLTLRNIVRATFFIAGGLCFFAAMTFFGFLALNYIRGGAGIGFSGLFVTPGGVLIGAIPFVGFCVIAALCFIVGATLCGHALVPPVRGGDL